MKLTIIYDNEVCKKGIGLQSDWKLACVIDSKQDTILFDTGAKGNILLHNMKNLNINIDELFPLAHRYGYSHTVILGIVLGMFIMALSLLLL